MLTKYSYTLHFNFRLVEKLDYSNSIELKQADKIEELYVQLKDYKVDEKLYKLENSALKQQLVCILVF